MKRNSFYSDSKMSEQSFNHCKGDEVKAREVCAQVFDLRKGWHIQKTVCWLWKQYFQWGSARKSQINLNFTHDRWLTIVHVWFIQLWNNVSTQVSECTVITRDLRLNVNLSQEHSNIQMTHNFLFWMCERMDNRIIFTNNKNLAQS